MYVYYIWGSELDSLRQYEENFRLEAELHEKLTFAKQNSRKLEIQLLESNKIEFIDENISIKPVDYYYTNVIARSSKVMSECRKISKKFLYTGIEKAS